jgi:tetraether lipid synthase
MIARTIVFSFGCMVFSP